jgi:hypothetical protein
LEGDLTLHLIRDIHTSGLLSRISLNPIDPHDMLYVKYLLDGLSDSRMRSVYEFLAHSSLISTVSMAIGNREAYKSVYEDFAQNRDKYFQLLIPGNQDSSRRGDRAMMEEWQEIYGSTPEEYDRAYFLRQKMEKEIEHKMPKERMREFLRRFMDERW